jgi:hypothetical protein
VPDRSEAPDELDAALDAWPKHHPMAIQVLRALVFDLMGPATRETWSTPR